MTEKDFRNRMNKMRDGIRVITEEMSLLYNDFCDSKSSGAPAEETSNLSLLREKFLSAHGDSLDVVSRSAINLFILFVQQQQAGVMSNASPMSEKV